MGFRKFGGVFRNGEGFFEAGAKLAFRLQGHVVFFARRNLMIGAGALRLSSFSLSMIRGLKRTGVDVPYVSFCAGAGAYPRVTACVIAGRLCPAVAALSSIWQTPIRREPRHDIDAREARYDTHGLDGYNSGKQLPVNGVNE